MDYPNYQFQIYFQIPKNCPFKNNVNYSHKKSRKICLNDFCCHNIVAEECENWDIVQDSNYINLLNRSTYNTTFLSNDLSDYSYKNDQISSSEDFLHILQTSISDDFKLPWLQMCE